MYQRTHAADALGESPGVARVAAAQDDFDAAHHGAGTGSTGNAAIGIGFRLDAQMPFDTGNRVDDNPVGGCVHLSSRLSATSSSRLSMVLSQ